MIDFFRVGDSCFDRACSNCGSESCAPVAPATEVAMLDIPGSNAEAQSLEQFVKQCGGISGFNITYSKTTQETLSTAKVTTFGAKRIKAAEFEQFLDNMLSTSGLKCARIGPDNLKVLLISPRAS